MGVIESARGVLWARRRQPDEKTMGLISSDPSTHVRKIKAMQQLGATAIVVMNISGQDPLGFVRIYGEEVLPKLREG